MSASKFKFISPGVFLEEIDQSRLPSLPDEMGPLIIGTSDRGPAYQPVRLTSIAGEGGLHKVFGAPSSGAASKDPSRYGVHSLGVDYGAWAAQAYLANNSPVTFIRILGDDHPNAPSLGQAGWSIGQTDGDTGGCFGLFVSSRTGQDSVIIPLRSSAENPQAHVVQVEIPLLPDDTDGLQTAVTRVALGGSAIGEDDLILEAAAVDLRAAGANGGDGAAMSAALATALAAAIDAKCTLNGDSTIEVVRAVAAGRVITITGEAQGKKFQVLAIDEPENVGNFVASVSQEGISAAVPPDAGSVFMKINPADDDQGNNANAADAVEITLGQAEVNSLANKSAIQLSATVTGILLSKSDFTDHATVVNNEGSITIKPKLGGTKIEIAEAVAASGGTMFNLLDSAVQSGATFGAVGAVGANRRELIFAAADQFQAADLAAIIHATTATDIRLATSSAAAAGADLSVVQASNDGMFTIAITNGATTSLREFTLDTAGALGKGIRDQLNCDPTATNPDLNASENLEHYWLAESFEGYLKDKYAGELASNTLFAQLKRLGGGDGSKFVSAQTPAETPWIRSQHLGRASEWSIGNTRPLFKLVGLDTGECGNSYMMTIENIKVKTGNRRVIDPYPTFTVVVRDLSGAVVDGPYTKCTLDPSSPSYIARKIGDQRFVWSHERGRMEKQGLFPNQSALFRVEVSDSVAAGTESPEMVPCSYLGPNTLDHANGFGSDAAVLVSSPKMRLRPSSVGANAGAPRTEAVYGIETRFSGTETMDESYRDLTRKLHDGATSSPSFVFSLELVKAGLDDGSGGQRVDANDPSVVIDENSKSFYYDLAGRTTTSASVSRNGEGVFNLSSGGFISMDSGLAACTEAVAGFAAPITGGFDGFDIRERDPLCARILEASGGSETQSSAYYSVSKAIQISSDPEFVECNILSIPGVVLPGLTDQIMRTAEARGDCLAVIDLPGIYTPATSEHQPDESARLGNIDVVVSEVKGRAFNNSFACAYAPWISIFDANGRPIWLPPSVAGIGTMGSSSATTDVWFAPAGFNRGGLNAGSAGLAVRGVSHHLTSKDRDELYDVAINPIASFPSENIVIFGQKTLQGFQSALDRINVRRLLIHVKKRVSQISRNLLFEPNIDSTWLNFRAPVNAFLQGIQSGGGLTDFRVILDETTTTPDLIDRNVMYAKVLLKPTRAIEFIAVDFMITNTGASFDD